MTVRFEGRVQTASLARVVAAVRKRPEVLYPKLRNAFRSWGDEWKVGLEKRFGKAGPESLRNRSGRLRGSLGVNLTEGSLETLRMRLTTAGVSYARLQEFGGEITPKNSKFLAYPFDPGPAVTPSGVARYPSARAFISAHPGQTFFFRADGGGLFLGLKKFIGSRGKTFGPTNKADLRNSFSTAYVLVKKVKIPPRLGFFKTWHAGAAQRRTDLQSIARTLGGR